MAKFLSHLPATSTSFPYTHHSTSRKSLRDSRTPSKSKSSPWRERSTQQSPSFSWHFFWWSSTFTCPKIDHTTQGNSSRMDKETIHLRPSFEWSSQLELVIFYNANVSCWAQVWGMKVPPRQGPWVSHTHAIYRPSSVQDTLGSTSPFSQIPGKMPRGCWFLRMRWPTSSIWASQTHRCQQPASTQMRSRMRRTACQCQASPLKNHLKLQVHESIRSSPGNAIHCIFFLIEIMSPKPLVASNWFVYESRSFPSGDYQHLKGRSSNPCDQGKTVKHQLCLVSGARNSKLLFLPPGPGRLLAS